MVKRILILIGHLVLVGLILVSFLPIANVYNKYDLPIGNDTVNFVYYTVNIRDNFSFPVSGWKYQGFEGIPRILDQSWLHFYLIQPLVSIMGVFPAVKIYLLAFLFLFIVGAYFLFYEISGHHLLSAGLALLLSRIGAIYIPLYSSGVALSSLSQTFYPWTFYFLLRFAQREERKSLYLAALLLALDTYTHPGLAAVMNFVSVVIFFLLFSTAKIRFWAVAQKFKTALVFFILMGLLSSLALMPHIGIKLFEGGHREFELNFDPSEITFSLLFKSLNPTIFAIIGLSLFFGLLFITNLNRLLLPLGAIFAYILVFFWGLYVGKNPLGGFMFPHRLYWALILVTLALVAALFSPQNRRHFSQLKKALYLVFTYGVAPVVLATSLFLPVKEIFNFLPGGMATARVERGKVGPNQTEVFGRGILSITGTKPEFFESDSLGYRFYTVDYGHNLALGVSLPLPQARGGYHFMTDKNADWFAWVDAVVSQESQSKERIDPFIAERQTLYILDWYAIGYLFSHPGTPGMLAPWLAGEQSPYVEARNASGENVILKIKPQFTSPIVRPSGSQVIGFVGSKDGYDSFVRNLGVLAYDSEYVIPIRAGEYLEEIKSEDLANFDGLFIYSYREKDKQKHLLAWEKIRNFANQGGVVLVDTGSHSPEKYLSTLPEIFPIQKTTSGTVGTSWSVSEKSQLFEEVDFSSLSPLEYEGSWWGVDYASSLRPDGRVHLAVRDKVVVAEKPIGKGRLIWSGLNFPYRMHYWHENAENEIKIFKALLDNGFGIRQEKVLAFEAQRPKSEKVIVTGREAKGVLFKENRYGGWLAEVKSEENSSQLKIYPAGPEFMYVRLPEGIGKGEFEVIFSYRGRPEYWFFLAITLGGLLFVLDGLVAGHKVSRMIISPLTKSFSKSRNKFTSWWDKDEERE